MTSMTEAFFKEQLTVLLRRREYDPLNSTDRQLLVYVFIPIVQRECDIFVKYWNSHRICGQDQEEIPTGVPEHMGIMLSKDQLTEVAEVSGVMDGDVFDFMDPRVKLKCAPLLSSPEKVRSCNAITAFRFFKRNFVNYSHSCKTVNTRENLWNVYCFATNQK